MTNIALRTSGLLAVTLFLASQAQAAVGSNFIIGNLEYTVLTEEGATGTVAVRGNDKNISGNLSIPSSVENGDITYSVTQIEDEAFSGCNDLKQITLPDSVASIGNRVFDGCRSLTNIFVSEDNPAYSSVNGVLFDKYQRLLIRYPEGKNEKTYDIPLRTGIIGSGAFYDCDNLTELTLNRAVKKIEENAFYDCGALREITIASVMQEIAPRAFYNCTALAYAYINSNLTVVGEDAFGKCVSLTDIMFDEKVTVVNQSIFDSCDSLKSVCYRCNVPDADNVYLHAPVGLISYYPAGNASWEAAVADGQWQGRTAAALEFDFERGDFIYRVSTVDGSTGTAFLRACKKDVTGNITVPSTVENQGIIYTINKIGTGAFASCKKLTGVVIPNEITEIEFSAFSSCDVLSQVTLPDSLTILAASAFRNCGCLTNIVVPPLVTEIKGELFQGCANLLDVKLEGNVTVIGTNAFCGCSKLPGIDLPESVSIIEDSAFAGCASLTNITLPINVKEIRSYAFNDCRSLCSIEIPEGVTEIKFRAFESCWSLTNIVIPSSVRKIENMAFGNCKSLPCITLPEGVISIGEFAFSRCDSLSYVSFPASLDLVSKQMFYGSYNLTCVYYKGDVPSNYETLNNSLYHSANSNLISYYPEGNVSWENAVVNGKWQMRMAAVGRPGLIQIVYTREFGNACECDTLTLYYTGTLYQSSDNVNWIKVESASSPYKVKMKKKKLFFCVKDESESKDITIPLAEGVDLDMIWIEPGTFMMGSPADELGRWNYLDEIQHEVTLTQGYWLGKYEVTQAQYETIMGTNPSCQKGASLPVGQVTWNNAMDFCEKLTMIEKTSGRLPEGYKYTLPTEAQWEYACRAGTTTALNSGKNLSNIMKCPEMDEVGWYGFNTGGCDDNGLLTGILNFASVGQKQPNVWGLYDMHGNVTEWCLDWYGDYPTSSVTDPTGVAIGEYRVVRGGSIRLRAGVCRSASRGNRPPNDLTPTNNSYADCGFRVALAPVK